MPKEVVPKDVVPEGVVPVGRVRGAAAGLSVQAEKTVGDVVRLLAAVVSRLRVPLLIIALAPVAPAAGLIAVSAVRGGSDLPFAIVLCGIGLLPSGWLEFRRRQLLCALQPPAVAAAEIQAILRSPATWVQVKANLGQVARGSRGLRLARFRALGLGALGPAGLGRTIWRGVKLGADVRHRVADSARLSPFLPGRLRGLALTAGCALVAFAVLSVLAVVKLGTTWLGIG